MSDFGCDASPSADCGGDHAAVDMPPAGSPGLGASEPRGFVDEPGEDGALTDRSAARDFASHVRLWGVAIAGLALDLWSKDWAFRAIGQGGAARVVIPGALEFQTMLNDGALFGMGRGYTLFFIVASVLALGLVFWMFAQNSARRWWLHVALGAILAGALGNMYDRVMVKLVRNDVRTPDGRVYRYFEHVADDGATLLVQEYPKSRDGVTKYLTGTARDEALVTVGYVRDFIHIPAKFSWGKQVWPWIFNVADMLLVGGVGILAIYLWRDRKPTGRTRSLAAGATPAKPT